MASHQDLMDIIDVQIGLLNDQMKSLQQKIMELSSKRQFEKIPELLRQQDQVIGALGAMAEAASRLQQGR